MDGTMKMVLTGGGTGGHLYPGLAVAQEVKDRLPCQILFIGTNRGLEAQVVPQKGYAFRTVWIRGLQRGRFLKNIVFPVRMLVSLIQALFIVGRFHPDVIVGTGGYVSWPVLSAGLLLGKRTVIQEQNRAPGLVTRVLAPFVDSVHVSFEDSKRFFKKTSNVHVSGNPTRNDLEGWSKEQGYSHWHLESKRTTLFIFGGSQGALSINRAMLDLLQDLMNHTDVQLLWATGPRWFDELQRKTETYRNRVRVHPYIQEMGMAYAVCDLVVCRAGATTVAEITRLGIPAVFIPFPGAAGGHQTENAQVLVRAGAAGMVLEEEIPSGKLRDVVLDLLKKHSSRRALAKRAKEFGRPEAVKIIADDIIEKGTLS